MHSIIQELIANKVVNEALISKQEIPRVDPNHPQNTNGPQAFQAGADGSQGQGGDPKAKERDERNQRTNERSRFGRQAECLERCMALAEYHCEALLDNDGLQEMEGAVTERLKLAAQMLKTAKEYISEIQAGYVAPPAGSVPQPETGNTAGKPSGTPPR